MLEHEMKKAQLDDDELDAVAGGRQYGTSPHSGYRTLTCPLCGTTYKVSINALSHASCPNCGGEE